MPWVRIADTFYTHPKVSEAGDAALGLHLRALSFTCHQNLDGRIPRRFVRTKLKMAERLILVGLWERDGEDYRIHDYLKYNFSAEEIKTRREIQVSGGKVRALGAARNAGRFVPADTPAEDPAVPPAGGPARLHQQAPAQHVTAHHNTPRNERRVYDLRERAEEIERNLREGNHDLRDFLAVDRSD